MSETIKCEVRYQDVDDRASEITSLHKSIIQTLHTSLEKAIRIGGLLNEQKEVLQHGEFIPWVTSNLPFCDRTARNYMKLYEKRDKLISENVSDLKTAYRLLKKPLLAAQQDDSQEEKDNSFFTISCDAAGKDIIKSALDAAKELIEPKSNSRAIEHICYEWYQYNSEAPKLMPITTAKRMFEETYKVKITIDG